MKISTGRRVGTRRQLRSWSTLLGRLGVFTSRWGSRPTPPENALASVAESDGHALAGRFVAGARRPHSKQRKNEGLLDALGRRHERLGSRLRNERHHGAAYRGDFPEPRRLPRWLHWTIVAFLVIADVPFVTGAYSFLPVPQAMVIGAAVAIGLVVAATTVVIGGAGGRLVDGEDRPSQIRDYIVLASGGTLLYFVVWGQSQLRERYLASNPTLQQSGINMHDVGQAFFAIQICLLVAAVLTGVVSHDPIADERDRWDRRAKRSTKKMEVITQAMEQPAERASAAADVVAMKQVAASIAQNRVAASHDAAVHLLRTATLAAHQDPVEAELLERPPVSPHLILPDLPERQDFMPSLTDPYAEDEATPPPIVASRALGLVPSPNGHLEPKADK